MELFDMEIKLKSYLNQNKIRLCDEPYTITNSNGYGLKVLAESLVNVISESIERIEEVLEELRVKSLLNIRNISMFKEKNLCSIKVYEPKHRMDFVIEIEDIMSETGFMFRMKVSHIIKADANMLKMIFKGKLINDNNLLVNLGVKNNSKIMILNMTESDRKTQDVLISLNQGRQMAEYLSKRAIDGQFQSSSMDLEITNQSGQVLQLTDNQKSCITYGLTMHKQATNYILSGNYQIALLHCLEADEAFTSSQYCDEVDNVAILQLDIVWCYFCLQNIDDITESKNRLEICERRMIKCYGEGNERIQRIREKTTFEGVPESVHIFRLYLMKAILAYYENDNANAIQCMTTALELYNSLSVPDDLIAEIMQLGFSREQAIDGLRVNKNVSIAVEYIIRRIEDLKVLDAQNQDRERKNKIIKRLGPTNNKSRIDLVVLERLIEQSHMAPCLCLAAIRRSNNNYDDALDLVFNHEPVLLKDIQLARHRGEVHDGDVSYEAVVKEREDINHIKELVNRNKIAIRRCLRQCDGKIDQTVNILLDDNFTVSSMSSSSSSGSIDSLDNEASSNKAQLEETIYRNIGPGSSHNQEKQYSNPDLFNEITAFNKFANLLDIPSISSLDQSIQWN